MNGETAAEAIAEWHIVLFYLPHSTTDILPEMATRAF